MEKPAIKKISLSDYEVLATLGTGIHWVKEGSFGRVRLARHRQSGAYFALKMLKKAEIIRSKQVDHVLNENSILSRLNHPFTVESLTSLDTHGRFLPG
jgi:serine/threonine protein kinase